MTIEHLQAVMESPAISGLQNRAVVVNPDNAMEIATMVTDPVLIVPCSRVLGKNWFIVANPDALTVSQVREEFLAVYAAENVPCGYRACGLECALKARGTK